MFQLLFAGIVLPSTIINSSCFDHIVTQKMHIWYIVRQSKQEMGTNVISQNEMITSDFLMTQNENT